MNTAAFLAFGAAHPGWSSNKEMRIRRELGITPPRYIVLLERAAASREGQAADPVTAHRVTNYMPEWRRAVTSAREGSRPTFAPRLAVE